MLISSCFCIEIVFNVGKSYLYEKFICIHFVITFHYCSYNDNKIKVSLNAFLYLAIISNSISTIGIKISIDSFLITSNSLDIYSWALEAGGTTKNLSQNLNPAILSS